MDKVHYSSKNQEWETPPELFRELDNEFKFTLDPCATPTTAKCRKFYTKAQDGLTKDWSGEVAFVNPPYKELKKWVNKAFQEYKKGNTVVMLLPARTDTAAFHDYIYGVATEIRFLRGRVKFLVNGDELYPAPFPSMVVVYKPKKGIFKWITN